MARSHHHAVAAERSAEDCQIWPANTAIATTPATTASRRRGDASGARLVRRPPAARSWIQASASATTSVRTTTENAPPSSQPLSFQSTATGWSGLPASK